MHSKWKNLEKVVLCDNNLVIIDTKKKKINISQSFIIFDNESCFQTHLQHNLSKIERLETKRNVTGNADDVSD